MTNRGGDFRLDKCCKTISIIMQRPGFDEFFNVNDLDALTDILVREAVHNPLSKNRVQVLKLLEIVLDNKLYREHKFRINDIEQMIQE